MRDSTDIAVLYLADRRVAYSSLAFHMIRGYFREQGVPLSTYFLEGNEVIAEKPSPHPREASIILVSLPYEMMYLDLVKALDYLGIPVYREQRKGLPVILAGGPAVTANPAPLIDIVDAFLVGEAEPLLDAIAEAAALREKRSVLERLADAGMLVPGLRDRVRRVYVRDLDGAWYPVEQPVPSNVEPVWGRSFMLETSRGCGRMCRFCMEGSIFRPKRDRSLARLRDLLEEGVEASGVNKVSFYSLAFFDSPHADKILEHAVSLGLEVSVPSIRAETLTHDRARLIVEGGQRTITIAPETGSCRVGAAINKCIGREGALEAAETALNAGAKGIKLYIMVGFPGEADEDLEETETMVREAALLARKHGAQLKVSINPFMPKPVTALQWAPLEDPSTLRRKIARIAKAAEKTGGRASHYDPRWAAAQVVLARGGPELAPLIVEWARRGGGLGALRAAAKATGIDPKRYTGGLPLDEELPWHRLVEHPYSRPEHLRREYELYREVMLKR